MHAACRGANYLFFSHFEWTVNKKTGELSFHEVKWKTAQNNKAAKAICNGDPDEGTPPCPVREECLQWAIAHQDQGVAGGMTARERRGLRRRLHLSEP